MTVEITAFSQSPIMERTHQRLSRFASYLLSDAANIENTGQGGGDNQDTHCIVGRVSEALFWTHRFSEGQNR